MLILELLKAVILGIIEGITEWLPVSSTGHLLLFNEIFPLAQDRSFTHMLVEIIQLAAILAVVVYFFGRLNPFSGKKTAEEKKSTWVLWSKILVAVIPGGLAVVLMKICDIDLIDDPFIIAAALLVYGIACQIFMPYLIIYMESSLGFSVIEYSVVFGGAIAVGAVVINRVLSSKFPDSVVGVIYQNRQFSPVASGRLELALAANKATESCYRAAEGENHDR